MSCRVAEGGWVLSHGQLKSDEEAPEQRSAAPPSVKTSVPPSSFSITWFSNYYNLIVNKEILKINQIVVFGLYSSNSRPTRDELSSELSTPSLQNTFVPQRLALSWSKYYAGTSLPIPFSLPHTHKHCSPLSLFTVPDVLAAPGRLVADAHADGVEDAAVVHHVARDVDDDEEEEEDGEDDAQDGARAQRRLVLRSLDQVACKHAQTGVRTPRDRTAHKRWNRIQASRTSRLH